MHFVSRIALALSFCLTTAPIAAMADTPVLHVYGPGGPAPAMKDVAARFGVEHGVTVDLVAGPTPAWKTTALADADVFFSGSENMMTDFQSQFSDIDAATVRPEYLRPAAILVHPGNPLHVTGIASLLKPGVRVMIVQGAGQTGMWEDIAGRTGDVKMLSALRSNIVDFSANSAVALQTWTGPNPPDAWIIYNIWQVAHPTVAQIVPIEANLAVWRDTGLALTKRGETNPLARQFYEFVSSREAATIFAKWGWSR